MTCKETTIRLVSQGIVAYCEAGSVVRRVPMAVWTRLVKLNDSHPRAIGDATYCPSTARRPCALHPITALMITSFLFPLFFWRGVCGLFVFVVVVVVVVVVLYPPPPPFFTRPIVLQVQK